MKNCTLCKSPSTSRSLSKLVRSVAAAPTVGESTSTPFHTNTKYLNKSKLIQSYDAPVVSGLSLFNEDSDLNELFNWEKEKKDNGKINDGKCNRDTDTFSSDGTNVSEDVNIIRVPALTLTAPLHRPRH